MTKSTPFRALASFACGAFFTVAGSAQQIVIQPLAETTSKDAKIYSGVPDSNFSSNLAVVSADIGAHFLSLVQFDLTQLGAINANSIISAFFTLYSTGIGVSGGSTSGGTVTVSPILNGWKENDADAGTDPLVTYNAFFGSTPTITFGSSVASQSVTGVNSPGFVTWDITNTVKAWVNGSLANNGVLVQLSSNGGDVGFADTDSTPGVAGSAPKLTVNVPEPTAAALLGGAGLLFVLRRRRASTLA